MTAAFISGLTVKFGDAGGPEVFTVIEEVTNLGGFGSTNPLVDVTSHDSVSREYIAGLADGSELAIECNRVHTAANIQDDLITAVTAKQTRNFQIALTDGSVNKTYDFAAVCLSQVITPSFDDKNTIAFSVKITGAITES
ncbi:MAG: hypothetical protein ABUJ92_00425 [Desulfobacterales bacterium]